MQTVDSLEKTLMLGGIGSRRRGRQRMSWLDGITDSMGVGDGQRGLVCCDSRGRKESDTTELNLKRGNTSPPQGRGEEQRFLVLVAHVPADKNTPPGTSLVLHWLRLCGVRV